MYWSNSDWTRLTGPIHETEFNNNVFQNLFYLIK